MLKKLLVASAFTFLCSTLAIAEDEKPKESKLILSGGVDAYYKIQNNYDNPWDSGDTGDKASSENRSGQRFRQSGFLQMLGVGGFTESGGTKYPKWLAVAQVTMKPEHPDHRNEDSPLDLGEYWIQYKPHLAVNIKLGSQTIIPTNNAVGTHSFSADIDEDFIWAQNAVGLRTKPGLSASAYLGSADHELGIAMLDGRSSAGALFGPGDYAAKTNALYYIGKISDLKINAGYQMVNTGGTEDTTSAPIIQGQYKYEKVHTMMNFTAKYDMGWIKPWLGYQSLSGDKADEAYFLNAASAEGLNGVFKPGGSTYSFLTGGLGVPIQSLEFKDEGSTCQANIVEFGFEVDLGPGQLAIDHSMASTPGYGESGSCPIVTDAKSVTLVEYMIDMGEGMTIGFFYHQAAAGDHYSKMAEKALANQAAIVSAQATIVGAAGQTAYDGIKGAADNAVTLTKSFQWEQTAALGLLFQMRFK